jgi:probable F420-dependent oxidoreductase
MKIGVVFPQTEIGPDPAGVRDYAQAAQDLGYSHLLAYDHVAGADIAQRPGWQGPYTVDSLFHEPFVLYGYLAAVARRLSFVTGILIAPQRQTVLIAKQAAEVDVLSGGKFRLGLGIGWNAVEYEVLNENFRDRGKRLEEQIVVLRALFTQRSVTYAGRWHRIEAAGIKPLPVQRPIPIWLGGHAESVLERVGRLADGWLPQTPPDERTRAAIERIHEHARANGRDPLTIGIESRISIAGRSADEWRAALKPWQDLGATHVSVNTMGAGLDSPQKHIDAIAAFMREVASIATP